MKGNLQPFEPTDASEESQTTKFVLHAPAGMHKAFGQQFGAGSREQRATQSGCMTKNPSYQVTNDWAVHTRWKQTTWLLRYTASYLPLRKVADQDRLLQTPEGRWVSVTLLPSPWRCSGGSTARASSQGTPFAYLKRHTCTNYNPGTSKQQRHSFATSTCRIDSIPSIPAAYEA